MWITNTYISFAGGVIKRILLIPPLYLIAIHFFKTDGIWQVWIDIIYCCLSVEWMFYALPVQSIIVPICMSV